MEIDHIIPKFKGGKDEYDNLQVLHRHCHDKKTYLDMTGTDDNNPNLSLSEFKK
jgi:RNA-directed DNA polymerase